MKCREDSYFWNKAVSQETGMASQPQAFQWAAPNQAELTFCANKPKPEGDVPGYTLWGAHVGVYGGAPAAPPAATRDTTGWRIQSKLRQDFRAPGSHREYRAGSSVTGDLSSFSCSAVLLGCDATETGTRCVADGQGGGRGPQESPFLLFQVLVAPSIPWHVAV